MKHIQIETKEECCGCGACVVVCPTQCITMQRDEEGFDYPVIDEELCIDCGRCLATCPIIEPPLTTEHRVPPQAVAAWNLNKAIRSNSSSGGVFSALAEDVISNDGVIYGAAFDNTYTCVRHIPVDCADNLEQLRGSKYVQSATVDAFRQILSDLKSDKQILFVGTPCQVAGLRKLVGSGNKRNTA